MKTKLLLLLVTAASLMACSADDGGMPSISEEPLNGTVMGNAFTVADGRAYSNSNGSVSIVLSAAATACGTETDALPAFVQVDVPDRIGFFSHVLIIYGTQGGTPVTLPEAVVQVKSVENGLLSGRLRSTISGENRVEGSFVIPLCQ